MWPNSEWAKSDQAKSQQAKSEQAKSEQAKSEQAKSEQLKFPQITASWKHHRHPACLSVYSTFSMKTVFNCADFGL